MSKHNTKSKNNKRNNNKGSRGGKPETRSVNKYDDLQSHKENYNPSRKDGNIYGKPSHNMPQGNYDTQRENDINWYNRIPGLFEPATKIPFPDIMGKPIDWPVAQFDDTEFDKNATPGIFTVEFIPSIGKGSRSTDWVNRCFQAWYARMSSKKSGPLPFQQMDLALFTVSMSSIAATLASLKRVLSIIDLYANENMYYPRAIIHALGYDYDTLVANRVEYTNRLNGLIRMFNTMNVPAVSNVFNRHYQLGLNIYAAFDDIKSPLYAFIPQGFYEYVDTSARCVWKPTRGTGTTREQQWMSDYVDIADAIQAWFDSDDFGLLKGNLLSVVPEGLDFIYIEPLDVIPKPIVPSISPSMAMQIRNLRCVNNLELDVNSLDITQDPESNKIIYDPNIILDTAIGYKKYLYTTPHFILDAEGFEPNSEFIAEATRAVPYVTLNQVGESTTYSFNTLGTEIFTDVYVTFGKFNHVSNRYSIDSKEVYPEFILPATSSSYMADAITACSYLTQLGGLITPLAYVTIPGESGGDKLLEVLTFGQYKRYAYLTQSQLDDINDAILASLYDIG